MLDRVAVVRIISQEAISLYFASQVHVDLIRAVPAACSARPRDRARVALGRVTAPLMNLQKSQALRFDGSASSIIRR